MSRFEESVLAGLVVPPCSRSRSVLLPLVFACLAMAGYALAVWPIVSGNQHDVSVFVQAGDLFVDAARTEGPVRIGHPSNGYDGQFYYRMAVAPFSFAPVAGGVHFDVPVYRSQRFLYPLLAWLASLGRPALAPAALFGVNLLGIGAIAAAALRLARAIHLPAAAALAIVLWPGFTVALTHDTSEIVSEAFLVVALLCYARQRTVGYALLGAAATLTRETTALVFGGVLLADVVRALTGGFARGTARRRTLLCDLALLLPLVAWHEALPLLWHQTTPEGVLAHDFSWPFTGPWRVAQDRFAALHGWRSQPRHLMAQRLINLLSTFGLFAFCVAVAFRSVAALRKGGMAASLAVGWLVVAGFLTLLRAGDGPMATPTEFCRAFSECWVVGCLVLFAGGGHPMATGRAGAVLVAFSAAMSLAVLGYTRTVFGFPLA